MPRTVQDILKLIEEHGIRMVDFKMVDINGQFRHVTIPAKNFSEEEYADLASTDLATIRDIADHVNHARRLSDEMETVVDEVVSIPCQRERAIAFHDRVLGYMNDVRGHVDALEMIVDDQMWPLPKYRELLFIH